MRELKITLCATSRSNLAALASNTLQLIIAISKVDLNYNNGLLQVENYQNILKSYKAKELDHGIQNM